ncbi:MAG: SpoIIE family protein phosphatase [Kiritimatiellales bacterium]|nr:SpoIIE family protein phosphatase [Kiritimatiellales bacterium]
MPYTLPSNAFLLTALMDTLSDAIYFKNLQSQFITVNKACAKKHGWKSIEEIPGKTDFDIFSEEHAKMAFADEQKIIATGESLYGIEEKETWPDGSITWVSTTKMPLLNATGEIIGTFGISRDITEHKLAELRTQQYTEEIRQITEAMEDDVRMAGELQKTFFPSGYPMFPEGASAEEGCVDFLHRFTATRDVSSDYCSIQRISDTEVGIFLCDVQGGGVRAALGTALIRGNIHELGSLERDPGRYLSRLSELLLPLIHPRDLLLDVTACYLVLDTADGHIRMASAGYPQPLHFRHDGETKWLFENLSLRGPALASQPGTIYPAIECKTNPGDRIVLFSDGLYTGTNTAGKSYGEKRLLGSARSLNGKPLDGIFQGLENDTRNFTADGTFSDDVCIVGIHFRKLLRQD